MQYFVEMLRHLTQTLAVLAMLVMITTAALAAYPEFPYPATDYREPYRGQFHFTAQAGWMNDVNGVWYYDGVYHLSYQAYPHSPQGVERGVWPTQRHWGHATSTDMIHWVHQPIMLEPDVNVPGDCWSGSVVVDTANTSGLKTGANPVLVALYTATSKGTCLAYSNDLGKTWQAYSANPLNMGGTSYATRDPHVFWYAPNKKWVSVIYTEKVGMEFYTSSDLKNWTKTSTFAWGHECPDIYELPVDGKKGRMKWVLQDASGKYHIGSFDGASFAPDPGGPYKMDVGPNFYAAQTFYRGTFPGKRVVQMGWLNGGVDTSPWSQSATFPVELRLKTGLDGVRLTRTPIAEIKMIYGASRKWRRQMLEPGDNILAGTTGKCFDLSAEFDLANATAKQITFQLPGKSVTYDVAARQLLGQPLLPLNNRMKIRMLVDWNQLEVFADDGRFSWTESVAFTPADTSLALTVDGGVKLLSMEFHELKRIWRDTAPKPL